MSSIQSDIWLPDSAKEKICTEEEEKLKESLKITRTLITALIIGMVIWIGALVVCLILFPIQTLKVCIVMATLLFLFAFCTK